MAKQTLTPPPEKLLWKPSSSNASGNQDTSSNSWQNNWNDGWKQSNWGQSTDKSEDSPKFQYEVYWSKKEERQKQEGWYHSDKMEVPEEDKHLHRADERGSGDGKTEDTEMEQSSSDNAQELKELKNTILRLQKKDNKRKDKSHNSARTSTKLENCVQLTPRDKAEQKRKNKQKEEDEEQTNASRHSQGDKTEEEDYVHHSHYRNRK